MSNNGSAFRPDQQQQVSFTNMQQAMPSYVQHHHHDLSLYTSSQASSSASSLIDQGSDHSSFSSSFGQRSAASGSRSGPGPSSSSQGYTCPNCGKSFARDDLLRRHLAREARALAQPSFDRQKSCYECARSKARCDLEVPSCGRCRARGKQCMYAPRSGNPNVRKARTSGFQADAQNGMMAQGMSPNMVAAGYPGGQQGGQGWSASLYEMGGYNGGSVPGTPSYVKREGDFDYDSTSENESGPSWNEPYGQQFRVARTASNSSVSGGSVIGSPRSQYSFGDAPESAPPTMTQFPMTTGLPQGFAPPVRTESPHSFQDVQIGPSNVSGSVHEPTRKASGFSRTATGSIVTNMDMGSGNFANEEGEETPIVRVTNSFAQATGLDPRRQQHQSNSAFLSTPNSSHRTTSLPEAVGDSEMSDAWGGARGGAVQSGAGPTRSGSGSMMPPPPQPPTLITSNLPSRLHMPNPSPLRPTLFTNGLDLSGWLEEPVVPSPLYRMGPSLHSSLFGAFSSGMSGMQQSPIIETPISARFAASLAQFLGNSTTNETEGSEIRYCIDGGAQQLPTAKQWWVAPDQSGEVKASIAQASAAHFVSYPVLIVLTDPTSPIPPFIHRRWLHENRTTMPASVAIARSILAGYYVRLPASEGIMWKLISKQIRDLIGSHEKLCKQDSDDFEVFGSIAALWMYLVLVVFTDDVACPQHVDSSLLDKGLFALSQLSETLSARVNKVMASLEGELDFMTFGRLETMTRTLFASYALLVLQRFRENAERAKLAGHDLVIDIPLPSGAAEFEAGNESEWRAHRSKKLEEFSKNGAPSTMPTLRQLVTARKDAVAKGETPNVPWVDTCFDGHDDFANVVLSVAFALDTDEI